MTDPNAPDDALSDAGRLLVEAAAAEAGGLGHGFVGTEHLLLALLSDPELASLAAAQRPMPSREELRQRLSGTSVPRGLRTEEGQAGPALSPQAKRLLGGLDRESLAGGGLGVDRRQLLERILTNPRGPLAQLLGGKAQSREAQASPEGETAAQAPSGAAAAAQGEPAGEPMAPIARPRRQRESKEPAPRATTEPRPRAEPTPKAERPARPERTGRKEQEARPSGDRTRNDRTRRRDAPLPTPKRDRPIPPAKPPKAPSRARTSFSWRPLLLLAVPASWAMVYFHAHPGLVFAVACLGVMPLAGYMGEATEHLATRTGPAFGGLLNATFGNAAELIIAIVALRAGMVDLVKASIIGSILGNLLLIAGLSVIAAGLGRSVVSFNRTGVGAAAGMLALAVVGLVFPALFHSLHPEAGVVTELGLSETVAIVLAVTYLLSLVFSLVTHRSLFSGDPHPTSGTVWPSPVAIALLLLATLGMVAQSEILVETARAVVETTGISEVFLGLILIPVIGNAAEHASAIMVARKGNIDLAFQISLGSSTQIALLVAPVLVLVGVIVGQPMNLVFTPFEVAAVGLATIVTAIITLDGETHWFEGVQLLATFTLFAATAWVM